MATKISVAFSVDAAGGQPLMSLTAVTAEVVSCTTSTQTVATGDSGPRANVVRVCPIDGHVHAAAGANPTATTADVYIPMGAVEHFFILPGDKLAFIED